MSEIITVYDFNNNVHKKLVYDLYKILSSELDFRGLKFSYFLYLGAWFSA